MTAMLRMRLPVQMKRDLLATTNKSMAICGDTTSLLKALPWLRTYQLYLESSQAILPADYTPSAAATTLCKIQRRPGYAAAHSSRPVRQDQQPSRHRLVERRAKTQMRGRKVSFLGLPCGRAQDKSRGMTAPGYADSDTRNLCADKRPERRRSCVGAPLNFTAATGPPFAATP